MKHLFARRLRREQTDVERKLWFALGGRRFHGFKFRRQQPIGPYIVDFVSFEADEIDDVRPDWLLTPEFETVKPAAAKREPQFALHVGLLASQAAGEQMFHSPLTRRAKCAPPSPTRGE